MYDEKTYAETYPEKRYEAETYPEGALAGATYDAEDDAEDAGEDDARAADPAYDAPACGPLERHRRRRHDFTFSTGQLSALVTGLAAVGLLLFVLGLAVGARLSPPGVPGAGTIAEAPPRGAAEPVPEPAVALAVEPVVEPTAEPVVEPIVEPVAEPAIVHRKAPAASAPRPAPPVAVETATVRPIDPGKVPARAIYELQIAYYFSREAAERGLGAFPGPGREPYLVGARGPQGQPRYTLRLGPFETMTDALAAQKACSERAGETCPVRYRVPSPDPPADEIAARGPRRGETPSSSGR